MAKADVRKVRIGFVVKVEDITPPCLKPFSVRVLTWFIPVEWALDLFQRFYEGKADSIFVAMGSINELLTQSEQLNIFFSSTSKGR